MICRKTIKYAVIIVFLISGLISLPADEDVEAVVERAEKLIREEAFDRAEEVLSNSLSRAERKGRMELLWRLSKVAVLQGERLNQLEASIKKRTETFEKAYDYAEKAIKIAERYDIEDADYAYFYRAYSNGRLTELYKNITALKKLKQMRKDVEKAISIDPGNPRYYVFLGGLYSNIPGPPISFGNESFGSSMYRYAIHLCKQKGMEDSISMEEAKVSLAEILERRNWSAQRREKEFERMEREYRQSDKMVVKMRYYEGTLNLPHVSDRKEAEMIAREVYRELLMVKSPNFKTRVYLKRIEELLEDLE
jgi:tetratricopeptide (TPR) repeat protein